VKKELKTWLMIADVIQKQIRLPEIDVMRSFRYWTTCMRESEAQASTLMVRV